MTVAPLMPGEVRAAFETYVPQAREVLLDVRETIFDVAKSIDAPLEETLKWGEPAYLTKGGSTVRLAWKAKEPDAAQVLFICTTNLVDEFRDRFADELDFRGNRAIHLPLDGDYSRAPLESCLALALTYKRRKVAHG